VLLRGRIPAAALALTGWLAVAHVGSVWGAEPTPTPTARELWNTYPLRPAPSPASRGTPAPQRRVDATAARSRDGDSPLLPVAAAVLVALGALAVMGTRRRRTDADAPAVVKPAAAPRVRERKRLLGADPSPGAPPDPRRTWEAAIDWVATSGSARFAAVARVPDSEETFVIAESRPLRWPPADRRTVQGLADAVDELERALLAAGWITLPAGRQWYAKRFAWSPLVVPIAPAPAAPEPLPDPAHAPVPSPRHAGRFRRRVPWPQDSERLWRCELRWDSGVVNSRFEVVVYEPGGGRGCAIAGGSTFKWLVKGDPDPRSPAYRAELARLRAELEDAGWEHVGRGLRWYSERFLWRRPGAPRGAAPRKRDDEKESGRRRARHAGTC
jgi:hypothetical protein